MDALARRLIEVRPSARQMRWQQLEWTAFFHFGMNTITNREWGDGMESPALFAPEALDTDQWCRAILAAGMRGCLLTAKHHDGFCLWHTQTTEHNVAHSPFKQDVVRMLADSCARHGLALGLYLSPWDRHAKSYGTGKPYNDFFCAQLEELLTGYGPLFEVWFDGACGEGANGRVQSYDWARYYALIRKHQPDACIAVCGPDVRWCGNEAGVWRESEWSPVPASLQDQEKIQDASQQSDDAAFRQQGIRSGDEDLGSRAVMADAEPWAWYPAEVNTSIRPGWFYHPEEDSQVKSPEALASLYEHTVGGNTVFLLNIPPTPQGRIHAKDEACLQALGDTLRARYARNLVEQAIANADAGTPGHEAACALADDDTYWQPSDGQEAAVLRIQLPAPQTLSRAVLGEQILAGQRIERFTLAAIVGGKERTLYEGTTVGYKRICAFSSVQADTVIIRIMESRVAPTLRHIALYE